MCDQWYSSVPGQTWPNRFFLHCATSGGFADNKVRTCPMRTIYENLEDARLEWGVYFHDIPQSLTLEHLQTPARRARFKLFQEFAGDAAGGRLPHYTFLEPRYFNTLLGKANDQHPPHDVQLGEHLIADVYDALRQSPSWEKTLFVIVYDEHGGIYDHVLPPPAVNPDGLWSHEPECSFEQLGLRVPAVLVSPRIAKKTVDSTIYDHASLLATVKEIFGLKPFLTERDRQAKTFTHLLDAGAARRRAGGGRAAGRTGDGPAARRGRRVRRRVRARRRAALRVPAEPDGVRRRASGGRGAERACPWDGAVDRRRVRGRHQPRLEVPEVVSRF